MRLVAVIEIPRVMSAVALTGRSMAGQANFAGVSRQDINISAADVCGPQLGNRTMAASWKAGKPGSRFKPDLIFEEIAKHRKVLPDGSVQFAGRELDLVTPIVASMLAWPEAAKYLETSNLVKRACWKAPDPLTSATFLSTINHQLKVALKKPDQKFVVLTSISLSGDKLPATVTSIPHVEIRLLKGDYPRRFLATRQSLLNTHRHRALEKTPSNYLKIMMTVVGKTPREAALKALDGLDLLRSFWCMRCNPEWAIRWGSTERKPINVIRLGNQHTVHLPDGKLASEHGDLWYEPNFVPCPQYKLKDGGLILLKHQRDFFRRLAASRYSAKLVSALLRCVRALDEIDPDTAFVRLWGALESIAVGGVGQGDYEKVVKRCAFLYRENEYQRQVMEHLREYRNSNIHSGATSTEAEIHCYQLQEFFRTLLYFHVWNAKRFDSMEEAHRFLDLPPSLESLQTMAANLRLAIRFVQ